MALRPETQLQHLIVHELRRAGWTVCVTTGRERRRAVTRGLPDVFVYLPAIRAWVALEVKTERGRVQPSQEPLIASGAAHIVRSVEDAFGVISEYLTRTRVHMSGEADNAVQERGPAPQVLRHGGARRDQQENSQGMGEGNRRSEATSESPP